MIFYGAILGLACFYANVDFIELWRVMLHNEPRSKKLKVFDYEKFINTWMHVCSNLGG